MIEPEMAFYELDDNMDLAEDFLKYLIRYALDNRREDLEFMNKMWDKGLLERLQFVLDHDFVRLDYTEGIRILEESGRKFEFPCSWGCDLAIGARALSGRGAFQASGNSYKLSQGDQGILYEAERRRQNGARNGRALPADRRNYRRFGA